MEAGTQDRTVDIVVETLLQHFLKNVDYYVTIYKYYETFVNSNMQLKSMR
jgi:hypothetical protein